MGDQPDDDEAPENSREKIQLVPGYAGGLRSSGWGPQFQGRLNAFVACAMILALLTRFLSTIDLWASYAWERSFLDDWWGFLLEDGQPFTAPVFMGEFGYANEGVYWKNFVHYLSDRDVDFGYWALNGKKYGEGFIDDVSGEFLVWAGCDTTGEAHRYRMDGPDCAQELGAWAQKGRGNIYDIVLSRTEPDTCVNNVPTNGMSCHAYCKSHNRQCVKAHASDGNQCTLKQVANTEDPLADGCLEEGLANQICVCTRQLWVWDTETFGLLERDYDTLKTAWRLRDLQALAQSPARWYPHDIGCVDDVQGHVCDDL